MVNTDCPRSINKVSQIGYLPRKGNKFYWNGCEIYFFIIKLKKKFFKVNKKTYLITLFDIQAFMFLNICLALSLSSLTTFSKLHCTASAKKNKILIFVLLGVKNQHTVSIIKSNIKM